MLMTVLVTVVTTMRLAAHQPALIPNSGEMRIWSQERRQKDVKPSTYFGSALFVAFSLVVLGTAYALRDLKIFVACFSVGAAIIAVTCYFALVSTISQRAERTADIGSPCAYATNRKVGVCPDTHVEQGNRCVKRDAKISTTSGEQYVLGDSANPDTIQPYLGVAKLDGMSTEEMKRMCTAFVRRPYTALNTVGAECSREIA